MTPDKQPKSLIEPCLKVSVYIRNIPDIDMDRRFLLAHIYNFGRKDCWQGNQTLARLFMASLYTTTRQPPAIHKYVHIKNPEGHYKTIWAKSYPTVVTQTKLTPTPKSSNEHGSALFAIANLQPCFHKIGHSSSSDP